jgi:hypothetical protein
MPQVPPGAQDDAAGADAKLSPPLLFEANTEILRRTCALPHRGHFTSSTAADERTNSSKSSRQSAH